MLEKVLDFLIKIIYNIKFRKWKQIHEFFTILYYKLYKTKIILKIDYL